MRSELHFVRRHAGEFLWTCMVTALITACILVIAIEALYRPIGTRPSVFQGVGICLLLALPIVSFGLYFVGLLDNKTRPMLAALSIWIAMGVAYFSFSTLETELRNHSMAAAERIQTQVVFFHQNNGYYPATIEVAMGDSPPLYAPTFIRRRPFYYESSTGRIGFDKPRWGWPAWTKRPGEDWREKDWWTVE